MRATENAHTVEATDRSFDIIEALYELDGARVTELADHLHLSKSTVYNHLATLQDRGYVATDGDEYRIGLRFFNLGQYLMQQNAVYGRARELSEYLHEQTGLESTFLIEENGRGVYLKTETGDVVNPHISPQIGDQVYLHTTAAGKAILAEYPRSRVERIVERWGLPTVTENTISNPDELFNELERIRERGYAFNRGEKNETMHALAVPVHREDGSVVGAVSVCGPEYQMSGSWFEEILPERVRTHVDEFWRGD